MNGAALEALLASLYSDAALLSSFLADPRRVAMDAGLDAESTRAMLAIDRDALVAAAGSYAGKRASHAGSVASGSKRRWGWRP